jgi:hypothetical protein
MYRFYMSDDYQAVCTASSFSAVSCFLITLRDGVLRQ